MSFRELKLQRATEKYQNSLVAIHEAEVNLVDARLTLQKAFKDSAKSLMELHEAEKDARRD